MASGTVAYTDTRGNKDYLSTIASQIGRRLKQASDMAAEERAYASKQAEENNTSLEEAGVGRGYFFGRALGSRFGGDRIARTRGRLGAQGPGTDPTRNYKQRFRGGFDYNYSEQINQVTKEVDGAIVPMSSALSVGLRGVESGLSQVSQSISSISVAMGQLAVAQRDLARQAMMNGAFMRAFMTYMQRQQSRAGANREERLLEGGRRRLSGGGGGGAINITPGSGGGGAGSAARSRNGVLSGLDAFQTGIKASTNVEGIRKAGSAIRSVSSAVSGGISGGIDAGGALVKAGTSAAKFVPDGAKIGMNAAKLLKVPASELGKFFGSAIRGVKSLPGISHLRAIRHAAIQQSALGMLGNGGFFSQLKNFITGGPDFLKDAKFNSSYENYLVDFFGTPNNPKAQQAQTVSDMLKNASAIERSGNVIDVPLNSSAADDFARTANAAEIQRVAASRMSQADALGLKSAEMATDAIIKQGTKEGLKRGGVLSRMMVKQFGAAGTKSILKKIPVIAGVAGIVLGIQRALEGDFLGAGLEVTSGVLGATGLGAPLSLGIDGFLLARDLGMVPMAKGGLLTGRAPVNALMGEAGPEIVTPLNDETFIKFGEGILDAQKRNKSQFISLHELPVKKALDDTVGKKSWWDGVKAFFGGDNGGDNPSSQGGFNLFDPSTWFGGGSVQPQTPVLTPPPPVTTGVTGSTAERNLAAFLSTLEATGDQNSMDALQVMLNRTALSKSGKGYTWAGDSLFEQITAREQFSPYSAAIFGTSADPNAAAKYGNIFSGSPEERRRKLLEIASGPDALNNLQTLFKGGDAASASRVLADLQSDGALAKESRRYIQGRTSFRGYRSGSGDLNRGRGGNFFFNNQGTTGMIDRISPLPFTSLGTSELQSQQLNQSSAENLRSAFNMPTIINNYNTTTVASGDSGGESSGAAFTALGLDAFTLPFSLASKA